MKDDPALIILTIAGRHAVKLSDICSPKLNLAIVAARWEVWRALQAAGYTACAIGRITGHNHSTVSRALRMARKQPITRWTEKPVLPPPNPEGRAIVEANIAAMLAKHQRDLAQRY